MARTVRIARVQDRSMIWLLGLRSGGGVLMDICLRIHLPIEKLDLFACGTDVQKELELFLLLLVAMQYPVHLRKLVVCIWIEGVCDHGHAEIICRLLWLILQS